MHVICAYDIEVRGEMDADAFNTTSPLRVQVAQVKPAATLLTVQTDQPGLVGLIRHLHQQGFVLLAVCRERELPTQEK